MFSINSVQCGAGAIDSEESAGQTISPVLTVKHGEFSWLWLLWRRSKRPNRREEGWVMYPCICMRSTSQSLVTHVRRTSRLHVTCINAQAQGHAMQPPLYGFTHEALRHTSVHRRNFPLWLSVLLCQIYLQHPIFYSSICKPIVFSWLLFFFLQYLCI